MAAVKTEEIREIRGSLDKSLRSVEEDANNLRGMLGKSLHKIDKYAKSIRRGEALSTETEESASEINGEVRKSFRRRTQSASSVRLKHRHSNGSHKKHKLVSESNHVITNGISPETDSKHCRPHINSPSRRYKKMSHSRDT